jgi:Ca-activated chloride channel family protein
MPPIPTIAKGPRDKKNKLLFLALALVVTVGLLASIVIIGQNAGFFGANSKKYEGLSEFEANRILDELYAAIQVTSLPLIKENVDLEPMDMNEILPDISKYPLSVAPVKGSFSVEIVSSLEKAALPAPGSQRDRWLVAMAEKFNNLKPTLRGHPVSVSVRPMASGLAMDYIISGKHVPDAFTPSNILWGEALKSKGIPIKLLSEKLVGNVAGIVIEKSKLENFLKKYNQVTVETIARAVNDGSFVMGYTNPLVSSTGANFLLTFLRGVSATAPLGPEAIASFEKFQNNIPFVAYSTLQMTDAAKSGVFDGFVYELQQFVNSPELKNTHVFTPFGARHDSPIYAVGNLEREKIELLTMFITYCRFPESQEQAKRYGFNQNEAYPGNDLVKGQILLEAQKLYKEKKTGQREVVAVFVADVSGSMDGAPLRVLKRSLIQGSKVINHNNYVGLTQFSDQAQIAAPIGKFDLNQRAIFTGAVNNMSAGGGTAMYDAIIVAAKMLQTAKIDHPKAKFMIIVLTDGESVEGHTFQDIAPMMRGLKFPIYTFGYNADLKVLKEVSSINEAASLRADNEDIVYQMRSFFNAEM